MVAVGSKGAVISRDAGSSWTPIDVEGAVYSATWGPCPDEWTLQTEDGIFHRTKGTPFTPEKWTGPRSMQLRALRRTTTGAVGLAVHLSPHGDADQLFVVTGR